MITFKEFLGELLNRKVEYTVDRESNTSFQTSANIGDRTIKFSAWVTDEPDAWEILFSERNDKISGTYSATGSGNELEVFSMVKDSILELISKYSPAKITFTADKEGNKRASVYDKLLKRFKVPGYTHSRVDGSGFEEFVIVRNDD